MEQPMLEKPFAAAGVLGKIKRANKSLNSFDTALYTKRLYKIYGDVAKDMQEALSFSMSANGNGETEESVNVAAGSALMRPDVQASFTIAQEITTFCTIAPRITDFDCADLKWPKPTANPDDIDAAFRFWLEHEDFRETVAAAIEELDFPNGKEGASAAMLTSQELTDPLSVNGGSTIAVNSKRVLKSGHGSSTATSSQT